MTTTELHKRLTPFLFPVQERPVFFEDYKAGVETANGYKAIVRSDDNQLIAIQKKTYKLVPNSEVIMPLIEELGKLDTTWYVDQSHSFVESNRMRMQVTFPELKFNDGKSDIALSLFVHNSYDSTESIRMIWGAIRHICTNGMIFGQVLTNKSRKHTIGLDVSHFRDELQRTYDQIPAISDRIYQLQNEEADEEIRKSVQDVLGKGVTKFIAQHEDQYQHAKNKWLLYNIITWYISHIVQLRLRQSYQEKVSQVFYL